MIEGTWSVISSNQRLQCPIHNCSLILINNMERYCRFLGLKVFNSDNSYMFSCSRNAQATEVEKPQLQITSFLKWWTRISNEYLIRQSFFWVALWIGHCHLCMRGHVKLSLQSPEVLGFGLKITTKYFKIVIVWGNKKIKFLVGCLILQKKTVSMDFTGVGLITGLVFYTMDFSSIGEHEQNLNMFIICY